MLVPARGSIRLLGTIPIVYMSEIHAVGDCMWAVVTRGARSAILSYWDRKSASAKEYSLVDIHLSSKSKSYSEASIRQLRSRFMDPSQMVRLETACVTALLSTWITSVMPFHSLPQCRSTCSTARIFCVLMCSVPWTRDSRIGIENADPGPG